MKLIRRRRRVSGALLLAAAFISGSAAQAADAVQVTVTIHADKPGETINPNVYGQFAEHLGTGIDGGIWVGPSSPIPNIRGYRRDVVEALQRLKVPVVRWPGGCFADIYRWRDGIGPRASRPDTLNKWWGKYRRDEPVRHARILRLRRADRLQDLPEHQRRHRHTERSP